jgi:hypothetical protein
MERYPGEAMMGIQIEWTDIQVVWTGIQVEWTGIQVKGMDVDRYIKVEWTGPGIP